MNALPAVLPAEDESLSQAEAAYRQLRDKLIMLDIRPGEPINDGQLATELGFGRTPVREAIKRLEVDHLVVSYPRRGTFATTVDFTELADVSEIRELLEPLAARRAAKRANTAMREELLDVAKAISELAPTPAQSRELMRYDLTVHRLIYRDGSTIPSDQFISTALDIHNVAVQQNAARLAERHRCSFDPSAQPAAGKSGPPTSCRYSGSSGVRRGRGKPPSGLSNQ